MELVPLCSIDATMNTPTWVGDGPAGTRIVASVESFDVTGERLRGRLGPIPAADWVTFHGTVGTVDVRAGIETHDGAVIYVHYTGRMDISDGIGARPFHVAPLFETADERYSWLNTIQAVGEGRLDESATKLHYDWYELRS